MLPIAGVFVFLPEKGMAVGANMMDSPIVGNRKSSQPVLPQLIVRRATTTKIHPAKIRSYSGQSSRQEILLRFHVQQSWAIYITGCCQNCDNLETKVCFESRANPLVESRKPSRYCTGQFPSFFQSDIGS
jgi:hypothetical protein